MKCHFVLASLLLGACSSGNPVQGAVLTQTLGGLDAAAYELKQVDEFVLEGGDAPLSVRVQWTFAREQGASEHPFGAVDLSVERNGLEASELECSLGELRRGRPHRRGRGAPVGERAVHAALVKATPVRRGRVARSPT